MFCLQFINYILISFNFNQPAFIQSILISCFSARYASIVHFFISKNGKHPTIILKMRNSEAYL